jgi:hypothetical protein
MESQWLWVMLNYAEPVVVSHGVECWASGCELWCAMVSQYLLIMVCNSEPVVVNHGVRYGASGCEWLCAILSQLLLVIMCIAEPVAVNHGFLCCSSGCESWWAMLCEGCESWCYILSQWLWILVFNAVPVVVNHGVLWWALLRYIYWDLPIYFHLQKNEMFLPYVIRKSSIVLLPVHNFSNLLFVIFIKHTCIIYIHKHRIVYENKSVNPNIYIVVKPIITPHDSQPLAQH